MSGRATGVGLLGRDGFVETSDGRALHFMVGGQGPDLVVLEAGQGFSGLYWGPVHAALAQAVRVVAYERSGFGASDADDRPRDLNRLASDLESLLDSFAHERLVLVGHSWGGPIIRTVAARRIARGRDVTGLVLVDPSDEHAELYFSRAGRVTSRLQERLIPLLARTNLLGPLLRSGARDMAEPYRSATVTASSTVAAALASAEESEHTESGLRALRDNPPKLGNTPVIVLSGQKSGRMVAAARASLNRAHRRTAAEHPRGEFVPAMNSGHLIPCTEPELIVDQVLGLLGAERRV